jgi:putative copper export protein
MFAAELVLRWIHIIGAITLVGGAVVMRFAYVPAMAEKAAPEFATAFRRRLSKLVMMSSGLLLISGLINFVLLDQQQELAKPYHMIFGIKFLLVFVVFFLSAALSGRSGLAEKLRQKESTWLTVNLIVALTIVCLAGYMKTIDRTPKTSQVPYSNSTSLS